MTTTTVTAAASLTCRRRWRCTICVSIFISSLPKKSSSYHPGVSPTPLPDVVLPSVTVVAEQVTPSRTSSSKSHVAIDIDETEYEELKNTLVPTVQPLPKKSSNLPGESPPPPSRTSSFAIVNIDETEHEELKNTLVRIVQPLPKKSSDLPGVSPPPSPSPTLPDVVLPSVPDVAEQVPPSKTSSSKSHVAIDINETEHENSKKTLVQIVQDKNLDSLRAFGGIAWIASLFGSDLVNGIDDGGREPGELLNITDQAIANKGFFYFLLKSCNSYTIFLLLISSGLCFSIDFIEKGPEIGWHDGVAVLFAVFILVMYPSVANFRRARKLEEKQMLSGALFTVCRIEIEMRSSPKLPTLRTSSFDCFKAVWPANADCWIAVVAIFFVCVTSLYVAKLAITD